MGPRLYPEDSDPPQHTEYDWSIDPEERQFYGEEPPPPGIGAFVRPVLYGLFAIGCAAALWYAYSKGRDLGAGGNGTVPLIRADQGATKVKPTQTGNDAAPDQDKLVYAPGQQSGKAERLLPPPEQPLAKPLAPQPSADAGAPLPVQEIGPTTAPKAAPPSPASAVLPPATSSGALTATSSAPLPPPAITAPQVAAKPTQTATGGGFRIQVAATREDGAARAEWERLKKAHADLLGELSPIVVKVDLGDKGVYYRVQAGPIADRDKAEKLCSALKTFSIACLVVKP